MLKVAVNSRRKYFPLVPNIAEKLAVMIEGLEPRAGMTRSEIAAQTFLSKPTVRRLAGGHGASAAVNLNCANWPQFGYNPPMPTINHLSGKPLRPITAPAQTGFYEAREFDLCATLRSRVARLAPDADIQPLVLEAYRAGWGLTEIYRAIAMLREEGK
jgi:hypothetical protein